MNLDLVMKGIEFTIKRDPLDTEINGIYYDSREVLKESAFVALLYSEETFKCTH